MCEYSSFKIGGPAELMIIPENKKQAKEAFVFCTSEGVAPFILGNGSNLLVSDNGIKGVVLHTGKMNNVVLLDETTVECDCGVGLARLCNFALDNSLSGLEFAFGIPGSVGGAAFMNAGAYGGEMKDVILSCEHVTPKGEAQVLKSNELKFGYRHSAYSENGFLITSIRIGLTKGDKSQIKSRMQDIIERRRSKQPLEYPSAGSVFKRPEGHFAGALVEQCGFKGKCIGGAMLSEKHAGFIVNKGGATCDDVLNLIDTIRETVLKEYGVELEREIKLIK